MKALITSACLVNFGDDKGGVHQAEGALIDAPKDQVTALVNAGRALYVNKSDDPDKAGGNTATEAMLAAAADMAKAA